MISDWSNATDTSGFWFGELSFHHVFPPETFVLGFCVPESCRRDCSVIQAAVFLVIEVYIGRQSSCGSDHQEYHSMIQYVVLGDL